jgi:hypothetical protein
MECDMPTVKTLKDTPPSLEEAQKFVGGYVEVVSFVAPLESGNHVAQLLVNEEGLLMGLPVNEEASRLAGQRIVGNALLLIEEALWE